MGITTVLCLALVLQAPVLQDPALQNPAPPGPLDVVTLKNGETMTGRITSLLDGYIELQLDGGATIGFSTAQVAKVARGAAAGKPAPVSQLQPRDAWFVLHDGTGASVGWLHATTTLGDTEVRLVEEWEFAVGTRRIAVTALEIANHDLQPRSCYWHERVSEPAEASLLGNDTGRKERIAEERILEGKIDSGQLHLQRMTLQGRTEKQLPFAEGATFPLLLQEQLRHCQSTFTGTTPERLVFDPQTEDLLLRSFQPGRRRTVQLDGQTIEVTELSTTTPAGRSAEWLDASSRTLRREIAGPALVAVPSNEATARRAAGSALRISAALVTDAESRLGLWLPNPSWQASEVQRPGQVTAEFPLRNARCSLLRLDQIPAGAQLSTAAEAMQRWFSLLYPGLQVGPSTSTRCRNCAAIAMVAEGKAEGRALRADIQVMALSEGFAALVCIAPAEHWDELAADFTSFQHNVEVDPQSLAPRLQGPIAEREKRVDAASGKAKAPAAKPAAAAAAPAAKSEKPRVLVPIDDGK